MANFFLIFTLFLGACICIVACALFVVYNCKWYVGLAFVILSIFSITSCEILAFMSDWYDNTPQAIDVYKGKTKLKIKYINDVPQDSIVIYDVPSPHIDFKYVDFCEEIKEDV